MKPRNPVGRPRLHPRFPPQSAGNNNNTPTTNSAATTATPTNNSNARRPNYRSNHADEDPDELEDADEWNFDEVDQDDTVRDRDWVNRQQDDRLPWSKRTPSTANNYSSSYARGGSGNGGANSYRNIRPPAPFQQQQQQQQIPPQQQQQQQQQRPSVTNQQRTSRGQFYQTQFVKPEPTRKATIPFLQPAFAPNASTQYPRDQPLPRLKPGTVRTRGTLAVRS